MALQEDKSVKCRSPKAATAGRGLRGPGQSVAAHSIHLERHGSEEEARQKLVAESRQVASDSLYS